MAEPPQGVAADVFYLGAEAEVEAEAETETEAEAKV